MENSEEPLHVVTLSTLSKESEQISMCGSRSKVNLSTMYLDPSQAPKTIIVRDSERQGVHEVVRPTQRDELVRVMGNPIDTKQVSEEVALLVLVKKLIETLVDEEEETESKEEGESKEDENPRASMGTLEATTPISIAA